LQVNAIEDRFELVFGSRSVSFGFKKLAKHQYVWATRKNLRRNVESRSMYGMASFGYNFQVMHVANKPTLLNAHCGLSY
jgi:hypothetical protein